MIQLIDKIKQDSLLARKAALGQDALVGEGHYARVKASLLITLISEADRVGKDAGNRAPTDEEVTTVIRKFVKNLDETLKLRPDDTKAGTERGVLQAYLPQPFSDAELRAVLQGAPIGLEMSLKNMKAITAYVNAIHPGRVTGQQLAAILKDGL